MPRFAANLSMMFNEWSFLDRFAAAADAGFKAVEFLFPYDHPADAVGRALDEARLTQALFNLPPGDWQAGERGMAAIPGREAEFADTLTTALPYIEATRVGRVHMMAGIAPRTPAHAATYRDNAARAADLLGARGVNVLLEPLNPRDMPGYYLGDFGMATALIEELGRPNLRLQFDCYHRQILHGDMTMALRALLPVTDHVQIASVPSRNEPDGEEVNYPFVFAELDRLAFAGYVGCEYRPRAGTLEGLRWMTNA
ncbi:2-oxo-tetronate isomerase [uncultured Alsobacter sp.]|uniref:2-oxo-tetronate isomerase n=1 Tax=uncultured Alsobacter sp. TaxID=1748258 RepID=UPI0025E663B3|nr:2-oxo-tetronate isomerase [uncultured Alsobacter sp.]